MLRTPDNGYIDGFDPVRASRYVQGLVVARSGQSQEVLFGQLASYLTRLCPLLQVPIMAYDIDRGEQIKRGFSGSGNVLAKGGLAITGIALEDQGYMRGINKSRLASGIEFTMEMVSQSALDADGISASDALLRDAPGLHELHDGLDLVQEVEQEDADLYWAGAYEAFAIAREIGFRKAQATTN